MPLRRKSNKNDFAELEKQKFNNENKEKKKSNETWEKFKTYIKQNGGQIAKAIVPFALSLLSGGTAAGAGAIVLVINHLQASLKKSNIKISNDNKQQLENFLSKIGKDGKDKKEKNNNENPLNISNTKNETIIADYQGNNDYQNINGTPIAKESNGKKSFSQLIKSFKKTNPDLSEKKLQLVLDKTLRPLLGQVETALDYLQKERNNSLSIFHGWLEEIKHELPMGLSRDYFDNTLLPQIRMEITPELKRISENVNDIQFRLKEVQGTMDSIFEEICHQSITKLTSEELFDVAQILIIRYNMGSKYDTPYIKEKYIEDPQLELHYNNFIDQLDSSKSFHLFVIAAGLGMGKTWTTIHLTESRLEKEREYEILGKLIYKPQVLTFYFPLRLGHKNLLKDIFGETHPAYLMKKLENIQKNANTPLILIFDGIDEIADEDDFTFFIRFMKQILLISNKNIGFIVSSRTYEWNNNRIIKDFQREHAFIRELFSTPNNEDFKNNNVSYLLKERTGAQLSKYFEKYNIVKDWLPESIQELCKYPYILRTISETITSAIIIDEKNPNDFLSNNLNNKKYSYYEKELEKIKKDNKILRNTDLNKIEPNNLLSIYSKLKIPNFLLSIFIDLEKENNKTIFYRMGLFGETLHLLFKILNIFPDVSASVPIEDLEGLFYSYKREFNQLLSMDLLIKEEVIFAPRYQFNPSFHEILNLLKDAYNKKLKEINGKFDKKTENDLEDNKKKFIEKRENAWKIFRLGKDEPEIILEQIKFLLNAGASKEQLKIVANGYDNEKANSIISWIMNSPEPYTITEREVLRIIFPGQYLDYINDPKHFEALLFILQKGPMDEKIKPLQEAYNTKQWTGTNEDLINFYCHIFRLIPEDFSPDLIQYLTEKTRFYDPEYDITAYSEKQLKRLRKNAITRRELENKTKVFGKKIQKGLMKLGENISQSFKKSNESVKNMGKMVTDYWKNVANQLNEDVKDAGNDINQQFKNAISSLKKPFEKIKRKEE